MSGEVYEVKAVLTADAKAFTEGLKGAISAIGEFKNNSEKNLGGLETMTQKVGKGMTLGLTAPLVAVGAASVKTASDFQAGMSEVKAISGATGDDMQKLSAKAQEMGAKTKFSASESADALKYMSMAGWKTEQMLGGLEGVMNLAAASGEDLGTTSDIVTDALSAFGMQASDSSHFADVLAIASSNANTNVSMLGESFKYVAPVCGTMGYSAEDTALALGLMANSGIKASQAGTSLRSAILRLANPSKDAALTMEELGINIFDANGKALPFRQVLENLREGFSGMSEEGAAACAEILFGKEAMAGMLAVINASDDDFNSYINNLDNADGAAQKMADTMNDNLQGQIVLFKSALEGAGIAIGNTFLPTLQKLTKFLSNIVSSFNELSVPTQKIIVYIGMIVASIGPLLLLLLPKLVQGFNLMKEGVLILGGAFSNLWAIVLAHPFVAIGVVIAAVALYVITHWEQVKAFFAPLWDGIKEKALPVWNAIKDIASKAAEGIKTVWNTVGPFFSNLWSGIKTIAVGAWQIIKSTIGGISKATIQILNGDWEGAKQTLKATWDGIKQGAQTVWNGIKTVINTVNEAIKTLIINIWNAIKTEISNKWNEIKTTITTKINEIKTGVTQGFTQIKTTISTKCNEFVSTVSQGFGKMLTTIKNKVKEIPTAVSNAFNQAIGKAKNFISQAIKVGSDLISGFVQGVKNAAHKLASAVGDAVNGAIKKAKGMLKIGSPSRLFRQYGKWTLEGYGLGIKDEQRNTAKAMANAVEDVISAYNTIDEATSLDALNSTASAQVDYMVNDNLSAKRPAMITLKLGNKSYRAFVEDIDNEQGKQAKLEEIYSI